MTAISERFGRNLCGGVISETDCGWVSIKKLFLQLFMRNLLTIPLLFIVLSSSAQLELGVFGGGSFYMGDLNPSIPFLQTKPAFGVLSRYNFNSRWVAKVNLYQGNIAGDDEISGFLPERKLPFESGITEFGGVMEFHFLPYFNGSMRNFYTPYLFGGMAVLIHRPKRDGKDLVILGLKVKTIPLFWSQVPPGLNTVM